MLRELEAWRKRNGFCGLMGVAGMLCQTGLGTDREMLLGANCSNVAERARVHLTCFH